MKTKNTIEDADDVKIDALTKSKILELMEEKPQVENERVFYMKLKQAQLGMVYKRDREIMKRVSQGQVIRVVNLISANPQEREKYIRASMPEIALLPNIEG